MNYERSNNICLVFLTLTVAAAVLIYMRPMLIPLTFSIFVYSVLSISVRKIETMTQIPKSLATLAALGITLLGFTVLEAIIANSVQSFIVAIPKYSESIDQSILFFENLASDLDIPLELEVIRNYLTEPLLKAAPKVTNNLLGFFGNLFLVFIFTIFMMTGESRSQSSNPLVREVLAKISSYIAAKSFLSLATGLGVWVVFLIFGIELSFVFALLTVLLNFIPTLGSIIAIVLSLPIIFLQYQLQWPFFVILGVTSIIQFTIGNVIEPKVMGDSMDLHPIVVLICLIFWGMAWGVAGMFLAVPITAILKIVFSRIEATKALSELLAGRIP